MANLLEETPYYVQTHEASLELPYVHTHQKLDEHLKRMVRENPRVNDVVALAIFDFNAELEYSDFSDTMRRIEGDKLPDNITEEEILVTSRRADTEVPELAHTSFNLAFDTLKPVTFWSPQSDNKKLPVLLAPAIIEPTDEYPRTIQQTLFDKGVVASILTIVCSMRGSGIEPIYQGPRQTEYTEQHFGLFLRKTSGLI